MTPRDPAKRAVNRQIADMTSTLEILRPHVMRKMVASSLHSLHATLGSKNANFIEDIKTRVLRSPDDYYAEWLDGLDAHIACRAGTRYSALVALMCKDHRVEQYVELFVKRTFLRQADDLSKKRPTDSEAEVWLGQNHASYGLLITPRFNKRDNEWENDKSEIRHFKHPYFTISHVLATGLVIPGKDKRFLFRDVDHYLDFFEHTLVRIAGSKHQDAVAERYVDYVKRAKEPETVPLLLPEVRFSRMKRHLYRLDFMVVEPSMMMRVGFELSPWSTHGRLVGTRGMTQKRLNAIASGNREAEIDKLTAYFVQHGINTITFADNSLVNPNDVFQTIVRYLGPPPPRRKQLAEVMARLRSRS